MSSGSSRATFQGLFQAGDRPPPFVVAVGDAKGVGSRPVTDDLAVNLGPAGLGVLEFFEDEHPGPFTQNEAVPIAIERAGWLAGARRCVSRGRSGG